MPVNPILDASDRKIDRNGFRAKKVLLVRVTEKFKGSSGFQEGLDPGYAISSGLSLSSDLSVCFSLAWLPP